MAGEKEIWKKPILGRAYSGVSLADIPDKPEGVAAPAALAPAPGATARPSFAAQALAIVPAGGPSDSASPSSALAAQLAENIKQNVGISAEIDVTPVGKVDRSAGKAVRIIDRRND